MITLILLLVFLALLPFMPVYAKCRSAETNWEWRLGRLPLWAFIYGQIRFTDLDMRFTLPWHWESKDRED